MNRKEHLVFDLQCALNDSGDWFTARLFKLMIKADCCNRERLRAVFPQEFMAFELWRHHGESFLKSPCKFDWFSVVQDV